MQSCAPQVRLQFPRHGGSSPALTCSLPPFPLETPNLQCQGPRTTVLFSCNYPDASGQVPADCAKRCQQALPQRQPILPQGCGKCLKLNSVVEVRPDLTLAVMLSAWWSRTATY